jgi:hypothetical protein
MRNDNYRSGVLRKLANPLGLAKLNSQLAPHDDDASPDYGVRRARRAGHRKAETMVN